MSFTIQPLKKESLPLKIYIRGLSGSGKTYGSLLLARGICPEGKIGIIDTLGGQSNQYAGDSELGDIQAIPFDPPFTADRCIEAIDFAVQNGCEVIVFDSMSAHHDGPGGQLERADEEEQNGAKGMAKWNKPKMETRRLMSHVRDSSQFHFIGTYLDAETTDMKSRVSVISPIQTKQSESYYTFHIHVTTVFEGDVERHPARWLRCPKEYKNCITQNAELTIEMGRCLAGKSGSVKAAENPTQGQGEGLDEDIATMIASEGLDDQWFNRAIKLIYKGKYQDWRELPDAHKSKLATDEGFRKIADKVESIKAQEGVNA